MNATSKRALPHTAGSVRLPLLRSVAVLIVSVLMSTQPAAATDTVYRCADGHSYSQQPCAAGQPVPVDDARTAEQRRDGEQVAQREAALAARLQRERETREAMPGSRAIGIGPVAAPAVAASAPQHKKTDKKASHHRRHKPTSVTKGNPTLSAPVPVPQRATP